jgi:hypothetical protein
MLNDRTTDLLGDDDPGILDAKGEGGAGDVAERPVRY